MVTVTNFVRANPTLPPARTLQSRFVNELARREDWRGLLAFSPEKPGTTEAQCNYYYAKWNTGQSEEALARGERAVANLRRASLTPVTSYLASGVRQVNKIRWRI